MTPEPAAQGTDFYLLDDFLTAEDRALRLKVRSFVDKDLLPVINGYWERAEFPFELIPKLAALGIVGTTITGFGCPGLSRLAAGIVAAEVSRGDGSVNTFLGVQSGLAMGTINMLGSEDQKQRWLPAMATLDKIGAFALTEPDHGSDSVALETTARRDGDSYIINGRKRWIGNASMADVVIIFARDDEDAKVKAFVMERNGDGSYPQGYSTDVITGKIGKRAILQPDITLEEPPGTGGQPAHRLPLLQGRHPRPDVHPQRSVLGVPRPRHGGLRDRGGLREDPAAVRQADRQLPAGAEQTRQHARRADGHAADLLPAGRPGRGRHG